MSKNYVSRSTEESRENYVISRLAIIESLFFVALSWGIAYYYDFYLHIYIAIGIAFFSFLKTPESTDSALEFFFFGGTTDRNYVDQYVIVLFPILLFLILFSGIHFFNIFNFIPLYKQIIGLILFVLIFNVLVNASKLNVIFRILLPIMAILSLVGFFVKKIAKILIGIAYIIPIKILRYIVLIPLLPYILIVEGVNALLIVLKSILIKVSYTLYFTVRHPIKAFLNIAQNSRELLFVNDIFYSPELIKGIYKYKKKLDATNWGPIKLEEGHYQLSAILKDIKNTHFLDLFSSIMLAFMLFLHYGYYFIVKSTAWLFFPLIFLSKRKEVKD